jgi:hypothetical protein
MEEDVKPEDEDGVDGRGVSGWDGWVHGLGVVGDSLAFGLVRGSGVFAPGLPSFTLVSRMPFTERYRDNTTSLSAVSSSRRESMVGGSLSRASTFRVDLGVGGEVIAPGFRAYPSHSCDGWVCALGEVGVSLVFGLVRGCGVFGVVIPSFVLVSRMSFAQRYRDYATSFSATSSSRREGHRCRMLLSQ